MKRIGFLIISIFYFVIFSAANGSGERPVPFRLSSIIGDKNLMGLNFESPELRLSSELEVQKYLRYRNQELSEDQAHAMRIQCGDKVAAEPSRDGLAEDFGKDPFCPLVINPKFGKRNEIDPAIRKEKKEKSRKVIQEVKRGDLNAILQLSESMTETDLSQSFRLVKNIRIMSAFARKARKQDHCSSNRLLVALGLRMESEFPSAGFQALAESLYKKAFECGKDQSSVAAGYRLGLFQISSNHWEVGGEVLGKIPESPLASTPIDYRMRIDYWRAFCAEKMKNHLIADSLKTKLVHDYPLSLHSLILAANLSIRDAQLANTSDPEVSLRSNRPDPATQAGLLRVTRDIELLLLQGERETAAILLKAALPRVLITEIPFEFYWAVLLQRAGDMATSFHVISNIFRQDPTLISRSTLKLLYPKEQFDKIQKSDPEGDPFLILSLVRQESAFDVEARSSAGAQGLMQLEWTTAIRFERVSAEQLWDPEINLRVGVKYLKKLESRFNGRLDQALAAYNAGPERIKEWSKRYTTPNALLFLDLLPLQETRDYVSAIARNYYWYKRIYSTESPSKLMNVGKQEDGQKLLGQLGFKTDSQRPNHPPGQPR